MDHSLLFRLAGRLPTNRLAETEKKRVTNKKSPTPQPEERFTVLVIRGTVCQDGWNSTYVEKRMLDQLRDAPLQAIGDINSGLSRGLESPDEVEELRDLLAMVRDHFPPMPLPPALLKNRKHDPAVVRAWCEEQLLAIQQELDEARRALAGAAFAAAIDENDNRDYCQRAAVAVFRLSQLTPDLHDTLWAVSLDEEEEVS